MTREAPAHVRPRHDGAPMAAARPPAGPSREAEPTHWDGRATLDANRDGTWAGEGRALPALEPAPRVPLGEPHRSVAAPHLSVVAPGAFTERHQAIYEIQEIPAEAARHPWPDLPSDPPPDAPDPLSLWRRWERRQRLAREQRGD